MRYRVVVPLQLKRHTPLEYFDEFCDLVNGEGTTPTWRTCTERIYSTEMHNTLLLLIKGMGQTLPKDRMSVEDAIAIVEDLIEL